jgi:hypothetical protein
MPMLLLEGFATSGKVAWEGWNAGAAPKDTPEPLFPKKQQLLMAIFWLNVWAAALKAVCAALLLYWKESSDLGMQWTPAIRGSNQADQTWISEKILDSIIEEARNRKFQRELTAGGVRNRKYQGEQTAVGAKNQFHHARLAHTEIGQITGTGSGSK